MKLRFLFFNNWFTLQNAKAFGRINKLKFNYLNDTQSFQFETQDVGGTIRIHCSEIPGDQMCDLKVFQFANVDVEADSLYPAVEISVINLTLILIFGSVALCVLLSFLLCKLLIWAYNKRSQHASSRFSISMKGEPCTPCDSQFSHPIKLSLDSLSAK